MVKDGEKQKGDYYKECGNRDEELYVEIKGDKTRSTGGTFGGDNWASDHDGPAQIVQEKWAWDPLLIFWDQLLVRLWTWLGRLVCGLNSVWWGILFLGFQVTENTCLEDSPTNLLNISPLSYY